MRRTLPILVVALQPALLGQSSPVDDVGLYVEPNSYTLLRRGSGPKLAFHFGYSNSYDRSTSMMPFTHDDDDDGEDSLGYYNRREHRFYLSNSNPDLAIDREVYFKPVGAYAGVPWPLVLNWYGGEDIVGVYDAGSRTFYLQGLGSFTWGPSAAYPVVGDWNGNGIDSVGLYAPSGTVPSFWLNNSVPPAGTSEFVMYGEPDTFPIAGDWNGDGDDEVGYFDPRQLVFHRFGANNVAFTEPILENFKGLPLEPNALPSLRPLAGNWDESGFEPLPYAWVTVPVDQLGQYGFDAQALQDAVEAGAALGHLNSLIVVRAGKVMKEAYFNGYTALVANHMMSATKSVLSALFGVANYDGALSGSSSDPQAVLTGHLLREKYLEPPQYGVCGGEQIDLLDVMTMSSGFVQNNDTWDDGTPPEMFPYTDYVEWILNGPGATPCASWWNPNKLGEFDYYGGNNHVAAEALRRYVEDHAGYPPYADLYEFAVDRLFERLGIRPMRWDHEPSSNVLPSALNRKVFHGESQMFMRPRDMARFGQLYLEGGELDGDVILDPAWVAFTTQDLAGPLAYYGCWWWRERYNGLPLCFQEVHCGYHARGFGGQLIYIFPSLDLLVVMTSDWRVSKTQSGQQVQANEGILWMVLEAQAGD